MTTAPRPAPPADPHLVPRAPVRVVCAAILSEGWLLVTRRAPGQRQAGDWELPGGKIEPGESERDALARELEEELGLSAQGLHLHIGARLAESDHDYGHLTVRLIAWAATLRTATGAPAGRLRLDPALLSAHDAACWADPAALRSLAWAPADLPLLPAVMAAATAPPAALEPR